MEGPKCVSKPHAMNPIQAAKVKLKTLFADLATCALETSRQLRGQGTFDSQQIPHPNSSRVTSLIICRLLKAHTRSFGRLEFGEGGRWLDVPVARAVPLCSALLSQSTRTVLIVPLNSNGSEGEKRWLYTCVPAASIAV